MCCTYIHAGKLIHRNKIKISGKNLRKEKEERKRKGRKEGGRKEGGKEGRKEGRREGRKRGSEGRWLSHQSAYCAGKRPTSNPQQFVSERLGMAVCNYNSSAGEVEAGGVPGAWWSNKRTQG